MLIRLSWLTVCAMLFSCASNPIERSEKVLLVVVAGERVLVGSVQTLSLGASGVIELRALRNPPIACEGSFDYSYSFSGKAVFRCTNDEKGMARIKLDQRLSGTGKGSSSFGEVHLAYGYTATKMNEILDFPENQTLVITNQGIKLMPGNQ